MTDLREQMDAAERKSELEDRKAEKLSEQVGLWVEKARVESLDVRVYGPSESDRLRAKAMQRPDTPPIHKGNRTMRQMLLGLSERWEKEPQKMLDESVGRIESALTRVVNDIAAIDAELSLISKDTDGR